MSEQTNSSKKGFSLDWLMRGVLTKLGDTFDRFTGRRWSPSSSLATSELIEKLKKLLDIEVKDLGKQGKFVPHNIKLKMQWDKFSTDSDTALKKLENELTIALIDHINDNRYHTYAPIILEVKPDYFTQGVKLLASFDKFADEEREAAIKVTIPEMKVGDFIPPPPEIKIEEETESFIAQFNLNGKVKQIEIAFKNNQRRSVGRTKENDLSLEDASVSKIHAALVLNSEKQLMVADTGSTNGTFINDKRIAYGRAFPITTGDKVKFGIVEVSFEYVPKAVEEVPEEVVSDGYVPTETVATTQKEVNTVAYHTNKDVSVSGEILQPKSAETVVVKESVPATEKEHVEIKDKAETQSNSPGTEDRVVLDFSKNE